MNRNVSFLDFYLKIFLIPTSGRFPTVVMTLINFVQKCLRYL